MLDTDNEGAICTFSLLLNIVSCWERVVVMVSCQVLQPSLQCVQYRQLYTL